MSDLNSGDKPVTQVQLLDAVHTIVGRLEARLDASETKVLDRIGATEAQMLDRIAATEAQMLERLEAVRLQAFERAETIETKLLTAFYNYHEFSRVEMRKIKADLSNVNAAAELRFENIESRLSALERIYLSKPPDQQPNG